MLKVSSFVERGHTFLFPIEEKLLFYAIDVDSTLDYTKMENLMDGVVDSP